MNSAFLRRWHTYIGLFIAPSILFFAVTGAIQIFNLHEAHGSYQPAVLLEKLSAVHKDQVFQEPHAHPAQDDAPDSAARAAGQAGRAAAAPADEPAATPAAGAAAQRLAAGAADEHPGAGPAGEHPAHDDDGLSAPTLALKWFFLAVALGLIVSTLIGVWMGTTQIRRNALGWTLLIVGALVPIFLLVI